jgi:hypothetical protein
MGRIKEKPIMGGCLDLGLAKPAEYGAAVYKLVKEIKNLRFVVMMEDRQPDFFLKYCKYAPETFVRLNRHGPANYYPTQSNLKSFVREFHENGIDVFYGFWIHENRWVFKRHPEILLTENTGKVWHADDYSADFNPLLKLEEDLDYQIKKGQKFAEYICSQYNHLSKDFGFNGLFLGDGGMGFRRFGDDSIGVKNFDYSLNSVKQFVDSYHYKFHDNCILYSSQIINKISQDICLNHWEAWVEWNCSQWTLFYNELSDYLHANDDQFAAYSCMNYGPKQAKLHGIDYQSIGEAGLDYLVFQTYDYAWSKHFGLKNKDMFNNLKGLLYTKADISHSKTKVLFTSETADSIEKWDCPLSHTLKEAFLYSAGRIPEEDSRSAIIDGAFIVWINDTPYQEFRQIEKVLESAILE